MKKIMTLCLSLLIAMTSMAEEWELVTDASTLAVGDELVLGYYSGGFTASKDIYTGGSANYLLPIESEFNGSELVSIGDNTGIFTLGGSKDQWTLTNQDGKTLAATAAKKLAWSGTNTWKISIISGNVSISSTNSNYGTIYYNPVVSGQARFCNYTSTTLKAIQLYRKKAEAPVERYTLTYAGYPYKKTECEEPTYEAGDKVTLSAGSPKQDHKIFKYWTFDGEIYYPSDELTIPAQDVVLVAVWENDETGVEELQAVPVAKKVLREGRLYIIRDGKQYDVLGQSLNR